MREKELFESKARVQSENELKDAVAAAEQKRVKEQAEKDARIAELETQLAAREQAFSVEKQLAVTQATLAVEKERDSLKAEVKLKETEKHQIENELKAQMMAELKSKDDLIAYKDQEIERYRDMKARLSTKMLGETLEQHCEIEFNKLRATAFPHAYFEKDNDASLGSKGDYIFRETDESGNEIISIMFEMKNEQDDSTHKHKNEDFLKKFGIQIARKRTASMPCLFRFWSQKTIYTMRVWLICHTAMKRCTSFVPSFYSYDQYFAKRCHERDGIQRGTCPRASTEY